MKILNESKGPSIPIRWKTRAFLNDIDVKGESQNGLTAARKPVKAKVNQSDDRMLMQS